MTLTELEATFVKRIDDTHRREVPIGDADGVMFLCPKCFITNRGAVGTHRILCWFVGRVPDHETPGPGRWVYSGSGISDLSFVEPSSASVALTGGCNAHFFIRCGAIEMC